MSQPITRWDSTSNRYLMYTWNSQYQREERHHFVEGGWRFFDWSPPTSQLGPQQPAPQHVTQQQIPSPQVASDSHSGPRARTDSAVTATMSSRDSNETLDPSYSVRNRQFFQVGKVFAVLFSETSGSTNRHSSNFTVVRYGERAYTQIRRFIVVKAKREFCYGVPIFTYGNQGTLKPGVNPCEHAIAYSNGCTPTLLPDEDPLEKDPICIVTNERDRLLATASRIYFGIHHPVQYNMKVKDIGHVLPEHIPNLLGYWLMEEKNGEDGSLQFSLDDTVAT